MKINSVYKTILLIIICIGIFTSCVGEKQQLGTTSTITTADLKVHFLDVGQADSILIQEPSGKSMLIDAGNNLDGDFVVDYISNLGIKKIDYVIGTHPHEDHIGGLDDVINAFDVGKIMMPKVSASTNTFEDVLIAIQNKNLKVTSPEHGASHEFGDAVFVVLAPICDTYESLNNYSVVIKLNYGDTSFLFTGDAETESEKEILAKSYDLKADVLKVGHHGSTTSTSLAFLKAVSPKYSIISVGKDNKYGHPDTIILSRLKTIGSEALRTDKLKTIVFTSNGKDLSYKNIELSSNNTTSKTASKVKTSSSNNVTIESIDLQKEIVTIKNNSTTDINMTNWKLVSVVGNQVYNFPNDYIIKAGKSITIASGDAECDLKWTSSNIWNNDGDPGELYDNTGKLVSTK